MLFKDKKYILFDMDGTLINNKEGIIKCIYYALDSLGIYNGEADDLEKFIGPPLHHSFKTYYDLSDTGADRAVEKYRERYSKKGMYECCLYDGIEDLLKELKDGGRVLCVASSKAEIFVRQILENLNIDKYFDVVVAASLDGRFVQKDEIIAKAIASIDGAKISDAIMIGDRIYDIEGAKTNNMACIGVSYGFAPDGELENSGADAIASDVRELKEMLI